MSIDEAINGFEFRLEEQKRLLGILDGRFETESQKNAIEIYEIALEALKEKKDREENNPLSWEELSEMHGKPVYFYDLKDSVKYWCLVDFVGNFGINLYDVDGEEHHKKEDYGKTFVCYKYPVV